MIPNATIIMGEGNEWTRVGVMGISYDVDKIPHKRIRGIKEENEEEQEVRMGERDNWKERMRNT